MDNAFSGMIIDDLNLVLAGALVAILILLGALATERSLNAEPRKTDIRAITIGRGKALPRIAALKVKP
jgi:hypothetical protein